MAFRTQRRTQESAFGELLVGQLRPQFQGLFSYTVDNTELTTNTVTNGGTITQADAMAVISSSTTTNSTALLESVAKGRYRAGFGVASRFTALFTTGVAGTEQYAGIADTTGSSETFQNGLAVGFTGETFGFHRWANDTLTTIAQADWDDPLDGTGSSGMILDPTKLNVWQIRFEYLGSGAIELWIEDDSTGSFVRVHQIQYANRNTIPSSYNPNYSQVYWVDNGATTSDIIVKSASYAYFIEGETKIIGIHQPQFSTGEQQKTSVTTEVAIATIRNKTTYASKTNAIEILLENIGASIEAGAANNLGKVRLVKDATLGGTPSYTDINTSDSVVEFDTAGTTVTGGKELLSVPLAGKNDKINQMLLDLDIILRRGETLTVAASSANSATVNASLLWKELF